MTKQRAKRAPIPPRVVPLVQRELWRAIELRAVMGWKKSKFTRWLADGLIPAPMLIGGIQYWRAAEIRDWIAAGCPDVRNEGWKWAATIRVSAVQAHALASKQLADAQRQLAIIDAAIEKGEKILELRRATP